MLPPKTWQQIMREDGCPEHLIRTPEVNQAAREYWIKHPAKVQVWADDNDERYQQQKALREQMKHDEAQRRIAKLKISIEKKSQKKLDLTGLTWDSRHAKWVSVNAPQEDEMAFDGTYSSAAAARKGAKRAGVDSFTIEQVGDRFKYVTSSQVTEQSAAPQVNEQPAVDTAPTPAEQPSATTEEPSMAKKKAVSKRNGGGPSKVEQVIAMCQRKSGCSIANIIEKLGVTQAAAASLIADVRRAHKSLKRDGERGASAYFL